MTDYRPLKWLTAEPEEQLMLRARAAHQRRAATATDPFLVARERDGYDVSLEGEIGEWAVAKAIGLPLHPLNVHGGDDNIDFVLPGRRSLSVKSTRHIGGVLLYSTAEEFTTDIAALTYVRYRTDPPHMTAAVVGWITRSQFAKRSVRFERGRLGTEVCVPAGALSPIELLVRWMEDRRTA